MSETQKDTGLSLVWELGLYIVLLFSFLALPLLSNLNLSNSNESQIYLFLNNDPIFGGKSFNGLVNSYFIISLILLVMLPVLAFFIRYFFEKKDYKILASLQSFLIYISCVVILMYWIFSLTVQKDRYSMEAGYYLCLLIYIVHIYSDLKDLRKMIEQRNCSIEENQVAK